MGNSRDECIEDHHIIVKIEYKCGCVIEYGE